MRKGIILFIAFVAVLQFADSCKSRKTVQREVRDSVQITVKEQVQYKTDTVRVTLPEVRQERDTRDTVSVLRNAYGESTASITGGQLHHTLHLYGGTLPTAVRVPVYYRDSIQVARATTRSSETSAPRHTFPFPAWSFVFLATLIIVYYLSHSHKK